MPTYQYACTACDHAFDQVQSFSDDALSVCPACSGRLRKVFNAVGVVFKGSGFYRTDSRSASSSADGPTGGGTPAKGDGAKSDGAKSDGATSGSKGESSSSTTSTPAPAASGS